MLLITRELRNPPLQASKAAAGLVPESPKIPPRGAKYTTVLLP
jgi:hypothetical protein